MPFEHKHRGVGKAVKWAYIMNGGQTGLTALFTFVLAAVLGPRDFGTVAMALVYLSLIQVFLEQGLVATLIQRKDLRDDHLDSVFWMGLGLSLFLMGLSISLSHWWAGINHLPQLALVISVLSFLLPIEALDMVQRAILQREMDFKSLSVRTNVGVVAGGILGLVLAFRGFGVWALVWQKIVQETVALILLWQLSHWRPRFRFELKSVKELWGISLANLVARLGVFSSIQSDALFMGIFFGPMAVGLYRLADRLVNMVLNSATGSIQSVSLPEFSRFQHDPAKLRQSMLTFLRLSAIVTVPAMVGLAAVSGPVTRILGNNWYQSATALKILSAFGVIMAFQYLIGPLLQAISKPHYAAAMTWGHGAISLAALAAAALFLKHATVDRQVLGIALTRVAVAVVFFVPIVFYFLFHTCRISIRQFVATVMPSFLAAFAAAGTVFGINATGWLGTSSVLVLAVDVISGAIAAGALLLTLDAQLRLLVLTSWSRFLSPKEYDTVTG
jgi:O-antigen/teichoic acid export membrane protein